MDEWSDDFADVFSNRLVKVLDILEKHPFIGMVTQQFTTIRKIAIDKKYTLYYLVLGQEVVVVNVLFNHRKN
ncbi:MAG: type II toxin-antitoxin system RelE/ParE family toxin [Spirosomaceae bacterium]|nr:type II toxin-antitoxin system RelE/ParE family toxin [Spirosomataceae bacterium]